jgi:MFS superfamily sulfate permease-like transporter
MNLRYVQQDLLASVVVFLVALPLCMGIAIASGAPPAAGLITGIIGGLVTGSLAGCRLQVSGPAAGMAVLVYQIIQEHGFSTLGYVVLFAGILQVAAGLLRAGQLFRSIAPSVIYGMLAGIGILIFGSQFHVMVDDQPRANGLLNLVSIPESIYKGLVPRDGMSHHIAAFIGVMTILIVMFWPKLAPKKLKWVPGALVGVAAATIVAKIWALPIKYVELSSNFFSSITFLNLGALGEVANTEILILALTVAFVASAETLLSAAAVDQMHDGERTNYNRELFAQGVGNTLCGVLGVLPMTGVIVRSATNVAAGAKTRLSAILHGAWLLILVAALPGLLQLIPTASLAAILVYTGYKLVNVNNIKRLVRYGGAPVVIYAATVIGVVTTDLLKGILLGIGLSIVKVIYARTHFTIRTEQRTARRMDVYLEGAATFLRLPMLSDRLEAIPAVEEVHIHFRDLDYIDDACLEALSNWERQRRDKGLAVILEWDEALRLYREKNPLGKYQRDVTVTASTH